MKNRLKYFITVINFNFIRLFLKKSKPIFSSILVIAPHPDDEIIGLSGVILQTIKNKGEVFILFLTDGEGSKADNDLKKIKIERIKLSEKILNSINISSEKIFRFHLKDGEIPNKNDENFDVVSLKLAELIDELKPKTIFSTHEFDYWPFDHVACSNLAINALKNSNHNCELWFYWVWTWHHLKPLKLKSIFKSKSTIVSIKQELKIKKKLISDYLTPESSFNKPWSGELPKSMIYPFSKAIEVIEKYENEKK